MDFGMETVGVSFETVGDGRIGRGGACVVGVSDDGPGVSVLDDSEGLLEEDGTGVLLGKLRTGTDFFLDDTIEGALLLSTFAALVVLFGRVVVTNTGVDFFLLTPV